MRYSTRQSVGVSLTASQAIGRGSAGCGTHMLKSELRCKKLEGKSPDTELVSKTYRASNTLETHTSIADASLGKSRYSPELAI